MFVFIVYALSTATLIVLGQLFWKIAVTKINIEKMGIINSEVIHKLLTSPYLWVGLLVYGIATIAYIYLLGRFNYFQVQAVVVGSSIVFTSLVSRLIFVEPIGPINIFGILLIILGIIFVAR